MHVGVLVNTHMYTLRGRHMEMILDTKTQQFFPPTVWGYKALSMRKHTTPKGALTLGVSAFRNARNTFCSESNHSVVCIEYFFSQLLGINRSVAAKDIFGIFTQIHWPGVTGLGCFRGSPNDSTLQTRFGTTPSAPPDTRHCNCF